MFWNFVTNRVPLVFPGKLI